MSDAAAERSAHVNRGHGAASAGKDPFVGPEFGPVRLKAVADMEAVCPTAEAVARLLRERAAAGLAKYGTTVAGNPLTRRQWLRHAQEEALDLAVYLQRLIDMEPQE